jgi:hypothetical protein
MQAVSQKVAGVEEEEDLQALREKIRVMIAAGRSSIFIFIGLIV